MKKTLKTYFYMAKKGTIAEIIYGQFFVTMSQRQNDSDAIFLKEEDVEYDFPELTPEEMVERELNSLYNIRDNLRAQHQHKMDELAEKIRSLQLLTHQSADYISKDDDIE